MSVEVCPKCQRPVLPLASEAVRASGQVCACGMPQNRQSDAPPTRKVRDANAAQKRAVPDLEQLFLDILAEHAPDIPKPLRQQELIAGRKFTTDFSWARQMVAVEIEGLCHRTKSSFYSDCEKHTMLAADGWKVLRFNSRMLRGQVTNIVGWLGKALDIS